MSEDSIDIDQIPVGKNDDSNNRFVAEFCGSEPSMMGSILKIIFLIVTIGLLYFRKPEFYIKVAIFVALAASVYLFG